MKLQNRFPQASRRTSPKGIRFFRPERRAFILIEAAICLELVRKQRVCELFPSTPPLQASQYSMSRSHQDELKCMYLSGLIDAGCSYPALSHFLEVTKSNEIVNWSLDQLRDAGQEFVQTHKSDRETDLEQKIQLKSEEILRLHRNLDREVSKAWKQGFLEGCIGDNSQESKQLQAKLLECGISDPVDLSNEELKRFYYAATGQFEAAAMERVATDYRTRLVSKEAVEIAECAAIPLNPPGSAVPAFTSPSQTRYLKPCKRLPASLLPREPASVEVTR